ncbi:MAG: fumarylacetoacetate hydrolase family protein [Bacillota bacterium]
MRFCTFAADGRIHVGVVEPETNRVVPLDVPDMLTLIRRPDALTLASTALAGGGARFPLSEVRLLAPIPRPAKNIYCVGLNYAAHSDEFTGGTKPPPAAPIIFSKTPGTVIGPGEAIDSHPDLTREVDYEAELAVVIGRTGRNIRKEEARAYIFGYTIINDVTARDLQRKHQQWLIGKSLDTFCPMGPFLVHRDEIPWPVALNISSRVNGELRQNSNTRHLIFDIPTLIETLSAGHTLEAGDIIATGTCEGVGMGFNPPRFLKPGDLVEVAIEGIGLLANTVR